MAGTVIAKEEKMRRGFCSKWEGEPQARTRDLCLGKWDVRWKTTVVQTLERFIESNPYALFVCGFSQFSKHFSKRHHSSKRLCSTDCSFCSVLKASGHKEQDGSHHKLHFISLGDNGLFPDPLRTLKLWDEAILFFFWQNPTHFETQTEKIEISFLTIV